MCIFDNSTLSWSAPINVNDGAIITMETSTMNGSRTYEDIIVHDTATINFDADSMVGTMDRLICGLDYYHSELLLPI